MYKDEMKMIEQIRKDFVARCLKGSDGCDLRDCQHCHAESLYNAGYRKVGEDEIVVKKSKIGMLEKTIDYLEMEKAQLNKQLEQAEQEAVREILQEVYDTFAKKVANGFPNRLYDDFTSQVVKIIANRHGIELE